MSVLKSFFSHFFTFLWSRSFNTMFLTFWTENMIVPLKGRTMLLKELLLTGSMIIQIIDKVFRVTICSPKKNNCMLIIKGFSSSFISFLFSQLFFFLKVYISPSKNSFPRPFCFYLIIAWFIIFVLFSSRNKKLQNRCDQFTICGCHHREHSHPIHSSCSRYNGFYE